MGRIATSTEKIARINTPEPEIEDARDQTAHVTEIPKTMKKKEPAHA
jgi:hypothetical protein